MTPNHGQALDALVFVCVPSAGLVEFEAFLRGDTSVIAAWHVVGEIDLVVHIRCDDLAGLEQAVARMRVGGATTSLHLVMRAVDLPVPVPVASLRPKRRSAALSVTR